ncbi:DUF1376 domain-containing protein [Pseudomonas synxantha]|uniref:DUF1376 domain-containing protein n=1 Tax=Pseudomonas synxantha TaxID=47883 RepID=UPI0013DE0BDE|nr:DUF1376 domain-containing protein [Pseudomonas synxantha]
MAALPYMQLYVADYLADTAHLTTEEHGAYLLLLFSYWQTGKPLRIDRLSTVARVSNERWPSVAETLVEFFNASATHWTHFRVEADLEAVNSKSTKASAAGKASAKARFEKKQREANANPANVETSVDDPLQRNGNHTDTDTDTDIPPPLAQDAFDSRTKFSMHENWQPGDKTFAAVLTLNGLANQVFEQDQFLEFKSFWIASPDDHRTQAKWEHALAQHLKRNLRNDQAAGRTTNGHQGAELPRNPQGQVGRGSEGRNGGSSRQGSLSAPDRVRAAIAERDAAAGVAGQAVDQNG